MEAELREKREREREEERKRAEQEKRKVCWWLLSFFCLSHGLRCFALFSDFWFPFVVVHLNKPNKQADEIARDQEQSMQIKMERDKAALKERREREAAEEVRLRCLLIVLHTHIHTTTGTKAGRT
jgi:hypothetical protein